MTKALTDVENIEVARNNYGWTLRRNPALASRIINHVDHGVSLVAGLCAPESVEHIHLLNKLGDFNSASADIQAEMVTLAREHLAEQEQPKP